MRRHLGVRGMQIDVMENFQMQGNPQQKQNMMLLSLSLSVNIITAYSASLKIFLPIMMA